MQPKTITSKNNGCGTAPGNLVLNKIPCFSVLSVKRFMLQLKFLRSTRGEFNDRRANVCMDGLAYKYSLFIVFIIIFCTGRFKKILNSMNKTHFHFILHRMVKRRNKYTEYCHASGKYPLLPSAKVQKEFKT